MQAHESDLGVVVTTVSQRQTNQRSTRKSRALEGMLSPRRHSFGLPRTDSRITAGKYCLIDTEVFRRTSASTRSEIRRDQWPTPSASSKTRSSPSTSGVSTQSSARMQQPAARSWICDQLMPLGNAAGRGNDETDRSGVRDELDGRADV
uniref:Uncharacterized protein n=1 Tax=Globodera rostochiensis TaxID=31243 RepID=A0A914H6T0_GLORO